MKKTILLVLLFGVALSACRQHPKGPEAGLQDTVMVAWNDPNILTMGRINEAGPDHAVLYWPGTSLKIRFQGTRVEVRLKDEKGNNYYYSILDEKNPVRFHPDSLVHWYLLADSLKAGVHTLELFKQSEWTRGNTRFYGFRITGEARLEPAPETSGRTIEFYGNSITAGYAIHDTVDDHPDSTLTDNYFSYAAITARHYNAYYSCIARSGIGILVSWFPLIMPEMWDRLDPADPDSKWDFSQRQPDIVVINLFQNDSWLVKMPDYPEFKHRFGDTPPTDRQIIEAYKDFVGKIRDVYPEASIICALGSMDAMREGSPWPGYIKKAVEEMNDPKIYTLFFPYMGKDGHPKVKDHREMADTLIHFINRNINP